MKHLNDLDQRLHDAAEETRQVARVSTPRPPQPASRPIRSGWLVFAGVFALVILVVGAIPFLTGRSGQATDPSTGTEPVITATTSAEATTTVTGPTEGGDGQCSAAGLTPPDEQPGLPGPVAETRRAIVAAAITCYIDELGRLAGVGPNGRPGPELVTSFGGEGFSSLLEWEDDGQAPLALLVRLLGLPPGSQEYEDLPTIYYWPRAFLYDTWDEIPEEDIADLLTVFTQEELDEISGFGSYAGWRVGIGEDGEWRFFVAGD